MLGQNLFCRRSTGTLSTTVDYTYVLRYTSLQRARLLIQAAAVTSVSWPMDEERRTNSARPRIASARAAAAALARSSTNFVEAPSRTKLLRRSIMAGAPVERGVNGSLLAVESMASTSSRRVSRRVCAATWLEHCSSFAAYTALF